MKTRGVAIGALLVLAACGVRTPTPRPTCVDPPPSSMSSESARLLRVVSAPSNVIYDRGTFPSMVARIDDGKDIEPALAKHVIDGLFPRHVNRVCPEITDVRRAKSWVDLDELRAKADKMGLFLPRVLQRIDGHFTSEYVRETLFVIDVGHCVDNGSVDTRYVVFDAVTVWDKVLAPRAIVDVREWHAHSLVGVVEDDGLDVLFARSCCTGGDDEVHSLRFQLDDGGRWTLGREERGRVVLDPRCRVLYGSANAPRSLYRASCDD